MLTMFRSTLIAGIEKLLKFDFSYLINCAMALVNPWLHRCHKYHPRRNSFQKAHYDFLSQHVLGKVAAFLFSLG